MCNRGNKIKNIDRNWKECNKKYLNELQIFFDKADKIQDENLKQSIISQMLICDNVLTEIAEDYFNINKIEKNRNK